MQNSTIRKITFLASLTALEIVLSRFCSINTWNLKMGFGFLPIAIAAMFFGALGGAIVGGLSDFLGAVLIPIGPYFPGFTLTSTLVGLLFGIFLHHSRGMKRIVPAVLIHQLLLGFLLNSMWISILYQSPFLPLLATRIVQCVVMVPVEIIVIGIAGKAIARYGEAYIHES